MSKVCVILTCYNRGRLTENCITAIADHNPENQYTFVVVDDHSSDDTVERLHALKQRIPIELLQGDGNLYYSGGMRMGIAYAKEHVAAEYYVLVNDDVAFADGAIDRMVQECAGEVLVGAVQNRDGQLSYGGIRYLKGIKYQIIGPEDPGEVDTFNANCVLLAEEIFRSSGNIDDAYIHTLGDFDYGLQIHRLGYRIRVAPFYVGVCNDNEVTGGWRDPSLRRIARFKAKETVKGAPFYPWFHYLKKNFGLWPAVVHSITPYLRIIVGK